MIHVKQISTKWNNGATVNLQINSNWIKNRSTYKTKEITNNDEKNLEKPVHLRQLRAQKC